MVFVFGRIRTISYSKIAAAPSLGSSQVIKTVLQLTSVVLTGAIYPGIVVFLAENMLRTADHCVGPQDPIALILK